MFCLSLGWPLFICLTVSIKLSVSVILMEKCFICPVDDIFRWAGEILVCLVNQIKKLQTLTRWQQKGCYFLTSIQQIHYVHHVSRVSKLGNIHNRLSNLIEKPFSINHQLLIECIFRQIYACFLTTMISFPVMYMLVFLC